MLETGCIWTPLTLSGFPALGFSMRLSNSTQTLPSLPCQLKRNWFNFFQKPLNSPLAYIPQNRPLRIVIDQCGIFRVDKMGGVKQFHDSQFQLVFFFLHLWLINFNPRNFFFPFHPDLNILVIPEVLPIIFCASLKFRDVMQKAKICTFGKFVQ